jgi:hypothetical protein
MGAVVVARYADLGQHPDVFAGLTGLRLAEFDALAAEALPRSAEAEDIADNRAIARRRVPVERTIGQLRQFQALSQADRQHRQQHTARVRAVAGLVNRRRRQRAA